MYSPIKYIISNLNKLCDYCIVRCNINRISQFNKFKSKAIVFINYVQFPVLAKFTD